MTIHNDTTVFDIVDNTFKYDWKSTVLDLLPTSSGLCLDVGALDGRHRERIEQLGYSWIGLDIIPNEHLSLHASGYALPFPSNTFDVVVSRQVLEHIAAPETFISEINRVLRPSGFFYGSASFLESFHESYFGFSHWGLKVLMDKGNFRLRKLRPGPSVFVMLVREFFLLDRILFDGLAPVVARLIFVPTLFLYKHFSRFIYWMFYGKNSSKYQGWKNFWKNAPIYFAAELQWVAQKM